MSSRALTAQLMLALAWATLPDLPTYRTGIIMVGLARCIAMVMIWNQLAHGDTDYCAILVIVNSALQIVLYSPLSLLFVNVISGRPDGRADALRRHGLAGEEEVRGSVYALVRAARALGPALHVSSISADTRRRSGRSLMSSIIIIFASQARRILDNIGNVFRVFVPLIIYFVLIWAGVFGAMYLLTKRQGSGKWGYEMAVVQAFTAGSNK